MNSFNIPFFQNRISSLQQGVDVRKTRLNEYQSEGNVFAQAQQTGESEKQRLRIEIDDLQQQLAGLRAQLTDVKAAKLALAEQNIYQQTTAKTTPATNSTSSSSGDGVRAILGDMC
jgi:chromosome segregation ATPase